MLSTILAALILGSFAGLAPGPYTTMVVGTALERGFRPALKLALTPLVTDVPPLIVTALVLETLSHTALTVVGIAGGAMVAIIGVRFLVHHRHPPGEKVDPRLQQQSARFWHVALSAILSPAPWLFWLVVGSPLMLRSWGRSPFEGILFVVLLFVTNMGTASSLAWAASHGRRVMSAPWRTWALRLTGSGLALAGALLIWQSLEGNFQELVERQEELRSFVEEQSEGR